MRQHYVSISHPLTSAFSLVIVCAGRPFYDVTTIRHQSRHRLFLATASYLFLQRQHYHFSRYIKRYKKATQDSFRHSSAGQLQRQHVDYLLTSDDMDELRNLELIEQLYINLRRQREQQQQFITATG